jgi:hypothetical protein
MISTMELRFAVSALSIVTPEKKIAKIASQDVNYI